MHDLKLERAPAAEREDDIVQPFLLESSGIRGNLVRLGPLVDRVIRRHDYPEPVRRLLAEMLALTAMLSNMLKYQGVFTLQTKGAGPVGMMVADVTSQGDLRGYAGFDAARLEALDGAPGPLGVAELLGEGYIAFTVDQGEHTARYQGIVELTGRSLAECVQHYFRQSEQVQTGLVVAAGRVGRAWRAAGLVLQRLPDEAPEAPNRPDEDAWRRAMVLQASCTVEELLDPDLAANDLLYRLFHEEGVRVFRRRGLAANCRCSRQRIERALRAMAREQIDDLTVDGEIVAVCEFCNRSYRFDGPALARLLAP